MTADYELPLYELPSIEGVIERAYRDRIGRNLGWRSRSLNSHRPVVVYHGDGWYDDKFSGLLYDAKNKGVISRQDEDEILSIHTIAAGEDRQDGSITYAAMDLTVTVQDPHIARLAARADILRRITGGPVTAAIVGAFISDDSLRQFAQERGVSLLHASLDDAKMERVYPRDVLKEMYSGKVKIDPSRKEIYE